MQPYRECRNGVTGELLAIVRISDNANIPLMEGNIDYVNYQSWVSAGNAADPDPNYTTDAIKNTKWLEIKNQRDNRKAGGVFVDNYWFHTDDASRIQWIALKDTARDNITAGGHMTDIIQMLGQNLSWKTLSGAFVTVTNQMAYDVVQATKNLDAILFSQAETKRQEVNASATPATYDTTTGWNKTYAESV